MDEIAYRSKTTSKACRDTPKTQNQRRKRGKTSTGSSKRPKSHSSDPARPSFPVKKRVQVPQHPLQETPTRPANLEGGKIECIKVRTQMNVSRPEDEAHLHENGETLFSPFFWLRDDGDAERTIEPTPVEPTPMDPVNGSPPDAPCFSDIKDSDDHMTSKVTLQLVRYSLVHDNCYDIEFIFLYGHMLLKIVFYSYFLLFYQSQIGKC